MWSEPTYGLFQRVDFLHVSYFWSKLRRKEHGARAICKTIKRKNKSHWKLSIFKKYEMRQSSSFILRNCRERFKLDFDGKMCSPGFIAFSKFKFKFEHQQWNTPYKKPIDCISIGFLSSGISFSRWIHEHNQFHLY